MTRWFSIPILLTPLTLTVRAADGMRGLVAGIAEFNAAYQAWDGDRFAAAFFEQASCCTSIGRGYETLGDSERAAAYFRKALAMHPDDRFAKEGLLRVEE